MATQSTRRKRARDEKSINKKQRRAVSYKDENKEEGKEEGRKGRGFD